MITTKVYIDYKRNKVKESSFNKDFKDGALSAYNSIFDYINKGNKIDSKELVDIISRVSK